MTFHARPTIGKRCAHVEGFAVQPGGVAASTLMRRGVVSGLMDRGG